MRKEPACHQPGFYARGGKCCAEWPCSLNKPDDAERDDEVTITRARYWAYQEAERKQAHYARLLDDAYGTPCEHIRHQQEVERLHEALRKCRDLFSAIRSDFYDPRDECDQGIDTINVVLAGSPEPLNPETAVTEDAQSGGRREHS